MAGRARDIDELLIAALAIGSTIAEAAAGVSPRTMHRRLQNPDFKARVAALQREITASATGTLADSMVTAARMLRQLLNSPSESVQLRAAVAILELGYRAVVLANIEERIRQLEGKLNGRPPFGIGDIPN